MKTMIVLASVLGMVTMAYAFNKPVTGLDALLPRLTLPWPLIKNPFPFLKFQSVPLIQFYQRDGGWFDNEMQPAGYGGDDGQGGVYGQEGGYVQGRFGGPSHGGSGFGGSAYGGPAFGGSAYGGPTFGGSAYGGPTFDGSADGGPAFGGSAYAGPAFGGADDGGPAFGGSAYGGPALLGGHVGHQRW